jgi:hypothetical protein
MNTQQSQQHVLGLELVNKWLLFSFTTIVTVSSC